MYFNTKALSVFFILLISFWTQNLFGQDNERVQGKATYHVSLNYNTGTSRNYDGELLYNDHSSVFTYEKGLPESEKQEVKYVDGKEVRMISKGRKADDLGLAIYSDFRNNKIIERNFIQGRAFIITDSLRAINWTLVNETKEIEGIECQKAKASVYGREYEVWFSNKFAVPYGPWKFQGLPGLILEARSIDGEINFELKSFQTSLKDHMEINVPTNGESMIGYKNFFDLMNKKADEFVKSVQAQVAEVQQSGVSGAKASFKIKKSALRNIEKTANL